MPNGLSSVLWFCAIVALIPVTLWFLKRTPLGGGGAAGRDEDRRRRCRSRPRSGSSRSRSASGDERRWLVLGVTPQAITTLHTMTPHDGATPSDPAPLHPAFAQILGRLRRPGAGGPGAR